MSYSKQRGYYQNETDKTHSNWTVPSSNDILNLLCKGMNQEGILWHEQLCQSLLWMMDSCFPCGKIIKIKQPIPHSKTPVFLLSLFFLLNSLITRIILLPSTKMRHQFLCHWELQISFELALEEMGGDRSGRRWRDKLMSMFELALTRSGRETTLGNARDFQGQIAVFSCHEWRFASEQHAVLASFQCGWVFYGAGSSQGEINMPATKLPTDFARSVDWEIMSNELNVWEIKHSPGL